MPTLIERLLKRKNVPQQPVPLTPNQILFEVLEREVRADAKTKGKDISPEAAICGARILSQGWELKQ